MGAVKEIHYGKPWKFSHGRMYATPGALQTFDRDFLATCFDRHMHGDWGEMCDDDKRANDDALKHGGRLFSAYEDEQGRKLWIITEADRAATTLLLPDEY